MMREEISCLPLLGRQQTAELQEQHNSNFMRFYRFKVGFKARKKKVNSSENRRLENKSTKQNC